MKIVPPIEVEKLSDCYKNNEQGNYGFYPLSKNNFWHGGIHLYSDKPIRAVADGTLVAYRLSSDYVNTQHKDQTIGLSDSFVLLKHEHETPNKQSIVFYSLYMHLRPWNDYKQTEKYPDFTYDSVFTINTKEDGKGLNIRGEIDKSQIVTVIPRDAIFKKLSDTPPSWTPPANEPDRYNKYRKVEYRGKVGYASIDSATCIAITDTLYRLTESPSDPAIAGTEGLAIRHHDSQTPVIAILPYGTQVHFENEADFKNKKDPQGYYKLDNDKHGDIAGFIYCKGNRIKEERKPVKPALDEFVKLQKVLTVKAGDILGYAGKWYGDNVIHFEIFSHTDDFLSNPKKDAASKPVYFLKKNVKFKEQTYEQPDPSLKYSANSILTLLTNEGYLGKHPFKDSIQVALQPTADVWVIRDALGAYDSNEMCYKISATITKGYTTVTETGEPDINTAVELIANSGEFIRFLDQKRDNYRLVRAKLKEGQRIAYWVKRSELQATYKKPDFWTSAEVKNVWMGNPEIPLFTQDLDYTLQADTEFCGNDVIKTGVFGQIWYGFKLPDSAKAGWVQANDSNLQIKDPYNWLLFFDAVKDVAPNGSCDCKELIVKIEAASGGNKNTNLTAEEIKQAIANPVIAQQLRKLIINDKTEWSTITDDMMNKWRRFHFNHHPNVIKAEWVDFIKKFQWWDHIQPVLDPLLKPTSLWFFHPIAFLEHLGRLAKIDLTTEIVKEIAPNSKVSDIERHILGLNQAITSCGIDSNIKIAHFLSQLLHESGCFKFTSELNKTDDDYDGFKGRGLLQLTWKDNYEAYGKFVAENVTSTQENKEKLEKDPHAAKSAGWYWAYKAELNDEAESNDFIFITYAVNGGFNGYNNRLEFLKRAINALCNNKFSTDYQFKNSKIYNNQKACFGWGLWHDPDSTNSGCQKDNSKAIDGYTRFFELYEKAGKPIIKSNWYGHKGSELPDFVANRLNALKRGV